MNDTSTRRPITFDLVMRVLFWAAVIVGVFWLVERLKMVLLPFLLAWLIAYLLEPAVQYTRRICRLRGRVGAVFITLLAVTVVLGALVVLAVPSITEQSQALVQAIDRYASQEAQGGTPSAMHAFLRRIIDFDSLGDLIKSQGIDQIITYARNVISSGAEYIFDIFSWFLTLLYIVFIMLDYDKLIKGFRRALPQSCRQQVLGVFTDVKDSMNQYFRGQALVALCVGILFSIGFIIIDLPLAVIMGLFIGVLNLVPYLQLVSLVPTTLLCLIYSVNSDVDFWPMWLSCIAVYLVVQCIQDFFLTPRIMGRTMNLNPAIILLSLSIWGSLLGIIGMIIALPMTTLLLSYYNRWTSGRMRRHQPLPAAKDISSGG